MKLESPAKTGRGKMRRLPTGHGDGSGTMNQIQMLIASFEYSDNFLRRLHHFRDIPNKHARDAWL